MAQHIHALMQAKGRVALDEIPELREALQYAHHGGKLSRQSVLGLDWVAASARKSQVIVIGAGVQGSISTLPDKAKAMLCAAAAEVGDRVAGIVMKHTVVPKRAFVPKAPRFTPSSAQSRPTIDRLLFESDASSDAASANAAPAVDTDSSSLQESSLLHMHKLGPDGSSVLQLELADPAVLEVICMTNPSSNLNPNPYPQPSPSP